MMAAIDPLMIELPAQLESARLVLRAPRAGDGAVVNEAVVETFELLHPWVPWAQKLPSVEESELACRQMAVRVAQRTDWPLLIFERAADAGCGRFIGGTGLHRFDWNVPRFEVGYWCRRADQGRGFVTEAVQALTRFAFDALRARRVEIRMSSANARSRAVAERCGFTLEGVLRQDSLSPQGQPRDTMVYARVRGVEEPEAA
jgi:RimJ/RimL family protein N-acetyltransferase